MQYSSSLNFREPYTNIFLRHRRPIEDPPAGRTRFFCDD